MSRHRSDFDTLEYLGSGSFGRVFKVRGKIDGKVYALKQIRISGTAAADQHGIPTTGEGGKLARILREARVLGSLSHDRIVRYYQCFVEHLEDEEHEDGGGGARAAPAPPAEPVAAATPGGGAARRLAMSGNHFAASASQHPMPLPPPPPPAAASPFSLSCNICQRVYRDYRVTLEAWHALDAGLQPLNLCEVCYKAALTRLGFDPSRLTITFVGGSSSSSSSSGAITLAGAAGSSLAAAAPVAPAPASEQPPGGLSAGVVAAHRPLALFIVTEFCELALLEAVARVAPLGGGTAAAAAAPLDRYAALASDAPACARIWALLWQVVEGLAYIHASSVIHRDLKPSNIFAVTSHDGGASPSAGEEKETDGLPLIKIGDLGLALFTSSSSNSSGSDTCGSSAGSGDDSDEAAGAAARAAAVDGSMATRLGVGTPVYMAPEGQRGVYGEFSDMYALGLVAFEMFARLPHMQPPGIPFASTRRRQQQQHQQQQHAPVGVLGLGFPSSSSSSDGGGRGWVSLRGESDVAVGLRHPPPALDGALLSAAVADDDRFELGGAGDDELATARSRTRLLAALKAGCVPAAFLAAFPLQAQLIANLMQHDPAMRPSASDLLRWRYFAWPRPSLAAAGGAGVAPAAAAAAAGGGGGSPGARERARAREPPAGVITAAALADALASVGATDADGARAIARAAIDALGAWERLL